ncbi:hypothetical protein ACFWGP_05320 [Agromyces sp. NPDC127015]|uniref:hypothetical protein n=1 Tax=Agromyces sp. NPDC127015 TaxID=3347108 RepID=UPI00364A5158
MPDEPMTQEEYEASLVWRDLILTCRTPGCDGEGIPVPLRTCAEVAVCNECGQWITDIVVAEPAA